MMDSVTIDPVDDVVGAVERGCGRRIVGGVYAETPTDGVTVRTAAGTEEAFDRCLYDPPIPVDLAALGVTSLGSTLVERPGADGASVWHLVDVVGKSYYPDVAGFVAEARRLGISRRVNAALDLGKLTARSRLILVHAHAWLDNVSAYFDARVPGDWVCPRHVADHLDPAAPPPMCISLWSEDLGGPADPAGRAASRAVGSTTYKGKTPPAGVTPAHRFAIFASFPVGSLAVIRDPNGDTHIKSLARARRSLLPVAVADA